MANSHDGEPYHPHFERVAESLSVITIAAICEAIKFAEVNMSGEDIPTDNSGLSPLLISDTLPDTLSYCNLERNDDTFSVLKFPRSRQRSFFNENSSKSPTITSTPSFILENSLSKNFEARLGKSSVSFMRRLYGDQTFPGNIKLSKTAS